MKLHQNADGEIHLFTAHGPGYVDVNKVRHHTNILVQPQQLTSDWTGADFASLTEADFEFLAGLKTDILLLGTGPKLRFPAGPLMRPLAEAGIGLEVMDLGAACRTYNILAGEGRQVTAALLLA